MKKLLFSLLFLIVSSPVFSADLKGFVEQVIAGELDPYFGDACIVVVRTPKDKLLGLVNRDEECLNSSEHLESLRGRWISVARSGLDRIENKKDLRSLREEVDTKATYYDWDGNHDVYLANFENTSKVTSPGLKKLQKLGREMERKELGGNAGEVVLFGKLNFTESLSLNEAIRQLLYAREGGKYLEEATVLDIPYDHSDLEESLEGATSQLIPSEDNDSWTEFRGQLTNTLVDLSEKTRGHGDDEMRYDFFEGGLGGYNNYSTSFIAVHDQLTHEVAILIQGYSE